MMWRNGTHIIDCMLWFAGSKPKWVMGDFEDGYEDYDKYPLSAKDFSWPPCHPSDPQTCLAGQVALEAQIVEERGVDEPIKIGLRPSL